MAANAVQIRARIQPEACKDPVSGVSPGRRTRVIEQARVYAKACLAITNQAK
jgi:hypothetical protein